MAGWLPLLQKETWYEARNMVWSFFTNSSTIFSGYENFLLLFMSWGRHCYFMSYFHQALEDDCYKCASYFVTLVLEEADMANNLSAISLYMKFDQCRLVSLDQYLYQTRDSFNFLWSA